VREFKVEVIEKASKPEAGMVDMLESLSDESKFESRESAENVIEVATAT
jgi:hypothetical protein